MLDSERAIIERIVFRIGSKPQEKIGARAGFKGKGKIVSGITGAPRNLCRIHNRAWRVDHCKAQPDPRAPGIGKAKGTRDLDFLWQGT